MPGIKQKILNSISNFFLNYFFLITLFIIVLFFSLSYIFFLKPQYFHIKEKLESEQFEKVTKEILSKRELRYRLSFVQKQLDTIDKESLEKISRVLPKSKSLATVIKELYFLAEKGGFIISNINFSDNENTKTADKEKTLKAENNANFKTLTFYISLSGGDYEKFKKFLQLVEKNVNIMDVTSLRYDGKNAYNLEILTYYKGGDDLLMGGKKD